MKHSSTIALHCIGCNINFYMCVCFIVYDSVVFKGFVCLLLFMSQLVSYDKMKMVTSVILMKVNGRGDRAIESTELLSHIELQSEVDS